MRRGSVARIFMVTQVRSGYPTKTDPTESCGFLPVCGSKANSEDHYMFRQVFRGNLVQMEHSVVISRYLDGINLDPLNDCLNRSS